MDQLDFELRAKAAFREEPARYEYEAPGREVSLPYLVTAFRGDNAETDLLVHYGIPLADGASAEGLDGLTVRTGAFLVGNDREVLSERRRTLYGLRSEGVVRFNDAQLWTDTQVLSAPPGKHEVSVEFETATGQTTAVQRREIEVPAFDTDAVAVSDVLLAYGIEEADEAGIEEAPVGSVLRSGLLMKPAPWSVFSRRQPVYLYFETYNTDAYDVRATLRPKKKRGGLLGLFGGRARGVSAEFSGSGTGQDYTILDANGLEPGLYTLSLRVTDRQTGRSAERKQDLFLEE
jgi:hypothetical protein